MSLHEICTGVQNSVSAWLLVAVFRCGLAGINIDFGVAAEAVYVGVVCLDAVGYVDVDAIVDVDSCEVGWMSCRSVLDVFVEGDAFVDVVACEIGCV